MGLNEQHAPYRNLERDVRAGLGASPKTLPVSTCAQRVDFDGVGWTGGWYTDPERDFALSLSRPADVSGA